MSNTTEQYDIDAEQFYNMAEKIGINPTEREEDLFCVLVCDMIKAGKERHTAYREAFSRVLHVLP